MKLSTLFLIATAVCAFGQASTQAPRHESLKQELRLSVERGLNFLRGTQNKQTGQWGTQYDEKQDLGRVPMKVTKLGAPVETLKISLQAGGTLVAQWGNTQAEVSIQ